MSEPAALYPPGRQIGTYTLEAPIGAGGMGVVYRAIDTRLNRPVAIKFLSGDLADPAARRRFQREAQTASSLNHPHILTVHDAGEFEGRQYLVTEFVDGGTLKEWQHATSRGWRQIVELLIGVADGLATAHHAGILHRDIKPENILISSSGYAKLADFGLAKLHESAVADEHAGTVAQTQTRAGVILGTAAYMSPEQALGQPLDARSDIFSFGVVLHEALGGRRPFTGASDLDLLRAIINAPAAPLPTDVPPSLRLLVEKALEKDPADRFQSMRDVVVDLRRVARQSTELPATSRAPAVWKGTRARYRFAAIAVLGLAAAASGALFMWRSRAPGAPAARPAYTQLTNFDAATQPALSADGRLLAFIHGPETGFDAAAAPSEIFVKLLPDSDPVQLTHDGVPNKFAPRFSPDGARIAYSTLGAGGWTTWVVPVIGGQEPRPLLANAEGLTWIQPRTESGAIEPRILFSHMTGKGITMAVSSATESRSGERRVFEEDGVMEHFAYLSPDGRSLLLAEMGFDGWQPCRLAPFDGGSKGKKVGPQPSQCTSAAWSRDGAWMYFSADTGGGFHVWRQRFPDGTPEQITSGTTEEEGIEPAPDGRSVLTSIGTRQSTLWIHDAHGDRQIASESSTFSPKFSADGKRLYYLVRTALGTTISYGSLWVLDLELGQRSRLLPEFQIEHYDVSRDGGRVVFVTAGDARSRGVWLSALDGRAPPRQLSPSNAFQAFFGAEGVVFFAARDNDGTFVYRVNEDGTGLRKSMPDAVYFLYGVSPDGGQIAVWPTEAAGRPSASVMLYSVDGGIPIPICRQCAYRSSNSLPSAVSWSPDGKLLYLALMGGSAVFAIPLPAGRMLPALPPAGLESIGDAAALPGAKPFVVPGAIPGPDSSVYAYAKFTAQRNIYRVPVP